jgi:hypothetical protein
LRGVGLDFLVIDECAFVPERAWNESLRSTLAERRGKAVFISTPHGRNWFWRLWQMEQNGDGEWKSWKLPSNDNPYFPEDEFETLRRSLPERIFRQEILAEFVDESDGVFRRVYDAATAEAMLPHAVDRSHEYIFGVDWGKYEDFTAIVVYDITTRGVVYVERFNLIDYSAQLARLQALYDAYRPLTIAAERNAVGDALIEQMTLRNLPILPITVTAASKHMLIEQLVWAFEQGTISIINDPLLVGELLAFEAKRLPSGVLRYSAPEGAHDDLVMALAFAYHTAAQGESLLAW